MAWLKIDFKNTETWAQFQGKVKRGGERYAERTARRHARQALDQLIEATPVGISREADEYTDGREAGQARSSWTLTKTGEGTWRIENTSQHLRWLLEDTEPGAWLAPTTKKAMRFTDGGSMFFSKGHVRGATHRNEHLVEVWERAKFFSRDSNDGEWKAAWEEVFGSNAYGGIAEW